MYPYLLFFHSLLRWVVLISLVYALYKAIKGWLGNKAFTASDDKLRHITATIAHIQLAVGYLLYFNSPFISYFRAHYHEAVKQFDYMFFGLVHISLMTLAIIIITIGSSAAKRQATAKAKFRTIAILFGLALLIIMVSIPWPFSPLAHRPYLRHL